MSLLTIDSTGVFEPKKGAFIINCTSTSTSTSSTSKTQSKIDGSEKIAAFDLDWTLIRPRGKTKFPKDYDDWILMEGVKDTLIDLYNKNYKIVIFTNQSGSKFDPKLFQKKIKNISHELQVPLQVFGCTETGYCRKPSVGLWLILMRKNENIPINLKKSFYVGDAAGREGDWADTDLKFALNIGIKFMDTSFFQDPNQAEVFDIPEHPFDLISNNSNTDPIIIPERQQMIILVGPPASSKTTIAQDIVSERENWIIVSQDELKTKARVIKEIEKSLEAGLSVIVDRKNEYIKDREELITLAGPIPVSIIWFDIPLKLSEHLCMYREIMTGKHIPQVVFNKYYSKDKGLEIPTMQEDVESIVRLEFFIDESKIENKVIFYSYLI